MATQQSSIPIGATEFDRLPDSAFVDVRTVATVLGTSVPSVWRWARIGRIPRPAKLSPGSSRWHVGALRKRMAELAEAA